MSYSIYYDKQPQKFLAKADKHLAQRIIDKIDGTLPDNPAPMTRSPLLVSMAFSASVSAITALCTGLIMNRGRFLFS